MTNSLQNRAIKKVIWEISIIVTLNLPFNFNPGKTDFSWKKFQNQIKSYKWKNLAENSLQKRCIKSIICEAEISSSTPLNKIFRLQIRQIDVHFKWNIKDYVPITRANESVFNIEIAIDNPSPNLPIIFSIFFFAETFFSNIRLLYHSVSIMISESL